MKNILCVLLLFVSTIAFAEGYSVSSVPNPKNSVSNAFVCNPDGILSDSTENNLNLAARRIYNTTDVELAIVAINSIDELKYYDEFEFGVELFNTWGIGKAEKNTGVLILLIKDTRWFYIHTGDGIEGILPDGTCSKILQNSVFPLLRNGNWDKGMTACVNSINEIISTDDAKEELLSDFKPKKPKYNGLLYYLIISFIILLVFIFFADKSLNKDNEASNNVRYERTRKLYVWAVIFAVIFPVVMSFFAAWFKKMRKGIRHQTVKCPQCGSDMKLLSEDEEDAVLDPKQKTEDDLKSIDYDAWLCPNCNHRIIYPYPAAITSYTVCAKCGAKAYNMISNEIISHATAYHAGEGMKTYKCKYCGNTDRKTYIIPRITTGGGSAGGSFSGGGSWGGGHTSGGGAGGRF